MQVCKKFCKTKQETEKDDSPPTPSGGDVDSELSLEWLYETNPSSLNRDSEESSSAAYTPSESDTEQTSIHQEPRQKTSTVSTKRIEQSTINTKRMEQDRLALEHSFHPLTMELRADSVQEFLLAAEQRSGGRFASERPFCLVGLHTCGDLGSTALRLFAGVPSARGLCVVPCCYHHITEAGTDLQEEGMHVKNLKKIYNL